MRLKTWQQPEWKASFQEDRCNRTIAQVSCRCPDQVLSVAPGLYAERVSGGHKWGCSRPLRLVAAPEGAG